MKRKEIAAEALVDLRRRLQTSPPRSPECRRGTQDTAHEEQRSGKLGSARERC